MWNKEALYLLALMFVIVGAIIIGMNYIKEVSHYLFTTNVVTGICCCIFGVIAIGYSFKVRVAK
ncbi:MAG: hypothetical protein ACI35O_00035 [Bacillaceae bacterium]